MKKVYCLVTRRFYNADIEYIKSKLNARIDLLIPGSYNNEELKNFIDNYKIEIILGTIPSRSLLDEAMDLKLIQIPWNGLDNVAFPEEIRNGVKICNSHSNSFVTAELAVSLMLALLKWIPVHDVSFRENDWRRPGGGTEFIPPETIRSKNVGILGFGHLGYEISRLLTGFDVNITAVNKSGINRFNSNIHVSNMTKINMFYKESDIIFVTVPLTSKTKNLIGTNEFNLMKNSAYLINTSRGAVINEEAFYNALKNKTIAGAAIDAWYNYPERGNSKISPSNFPFAELENVVMSPHRGGFVKKMLPHLDDAITNLNFYVEGKPLINVVDISETY